MLCMGLDVSKAATGWAVTDGERWESGVLKCPVKRPFSLDKNEICPVYTGEVMQWYAVALTALLGAQEPDVIAIEKPMPGNSSRKKMVPNKNPGFAGPTMIAVDVGGTSIETTHFLHSLAAEAARVAFRANIRTRYIASQSWRSAVGVQWPKRKPKGSTEDEKKNTRHYKDEARRICALNKIAVTNDDQAEAACIALWLYNEECPVNRRAAEGLFAGLR